MIAQDCKLRKYREIFPLPGGPNLRRPTTPAPAGPSRRRHRVFRGRQPRRDPPAASLACAGITPSLLSPHIAHAQKVRYQKTQYSRDARDDDRAAARQPPRSACSPLCLSFIDPRPPGERTSAPSTTAPQASGVTRIERTPWRIPLMPEAGNDIEQTAQDLSRPGRTKALASSTPNWRCLTVLNHCIVRPR